MYTLLSEQIAELEIERSKFIAVTRHIESLDEIKDTLKDIKKRYPKAKHYCYGYVINGNYKGNDDGEPKGTAGRPLSELLKSKELDNVIVVVVRYFGGILLGASRLLRTYVEVANKALSIQKRYEITYKNLYVSSLEYRYLDDFRAFLKNLKIVNEEIEYDEIKPSIKFLANSKIEQEVINAFNGKIIIEKLKENIICYEEEKENE